ncbi:hypothetical protein ACFYXF_04640 [Streptomyces sp. NPDC002680]|uniref:hypothetical protein n=1 Tax=Streptomyces sp. NPDC002680 TaxID=3364659 RepID=UPI0036B1C905
MPPVTTFDAHFLNHVELLHRPGEGELATLFFETLGCTVVDLTDVFGASRRLLGVFAGPSDRDALNNVLYISEFREPQRQLDDVLARLMRDSEELRTAIARHDEVRSKPGDVTHFGLRYPTFEALADVVDRLRKSLPAELAGRVTVHPSAPVALPALAAEVDQAFVHTDVIGAGLFPFGQLIELQAQRPLEA